MPVARAAFFATRLSPVPVFRIVRFADFTTFVVLDFLRLAILFPPVRYLVGPSPRPHCNATCMCCNLFRLLPGAYSDVVLPGEALAAAVEQGPWRICSYLPAVAKSAMCDSTMRASRSRKVPAIFRHSCARRRYSSALLHP
jgi:hypothetical protein